MDLLDILCLWDLGCVLCIFVGCFIDGCIFVEMIILVVFIGFCFRRFFCFLGVELGINGFVVLLIRLGFWYVLGFVFCDKFGELGGLNKEECCICLGLKFNKFFFLILLYLYFWVVKFFVKGFVFGKLTIGNVSVIGVCFLVVFKVFFVVVENVLLSLDVGIYFGKFFVFLFLFVLKYFFVIGMFL